jgi:hypothetical protein
MKTTVLAFCVVFCGMALGQSKTPADRFSQLDRNTDGKLSADEVASMPSLARLLPVADTDKDGGLSREEIRKASERFSTLAQLIGEKPPANNPPAAPTPAAEGRRTRVPPNNAPIDPKWGPDIEPRETSFRFTFVPEFHPGTNDANGQLLGGTELMRLAAHEGKLSAGVGYFGQDPRKPHAPGAQVLRKDSAASGWVVDATFPDYVRVDTLVSVTFTSDANGQELAKPVTMLVAGLWWRKVKPWGQHAVHRLDDGAVTGEIARRLDPETLVGQHELFVYYTRFLRGGVSELRRCRADVKANP